ncbi:class I SAM-dependent methyltransferase [Photobacterium sp. TY1-4]|uniref:class I SAM-dependent methyltransferase n=1 Tax=Photobacterium sp. TY1-4 TaxID=2899122 RepID=UPI0021C24682|nr:class I SAM-dependent methyltransferase [Photobacterium sp. TY1-4]UXI04388.1 methyltransferase domain-containing protein [Photobacterium sp. TY1-4]
MATVDWLNCLNNPKLLPPRSHLMEAHQFLGHFANDRVAVDCGCGTGRDTLFLIEQGYQVYAFDIDLNSLQVLSEHPLAAAAPQLDVQQSSFAEYRFPRAHLINASACLFFNSREEFRQLWPKIEQNLYSGGIFCGHFLGEDEQDSNEKLPVLTLTRPELEQLFTNFYMVSWKEKREYSAQLTGKKRAWLVHTVIAMKR